MAALRLTIVEAQAKTWDSREEMEKEFKRSRLHLIGADYMPGQNAEGKWCIVDRPAPEPEDNVVRLSEAKKKAARKEPRKEPQKRPVRPQEPKPEAEGEYKGPTIKGGPNVSKLPDGFVPWAIEQACRDEGVSRKELSDQSQQNGAKWLRYLMEIAKREGLACRMGKRDRYNNFWMFKPET